MPPLLAARARRLAVTMGGVIGGSFALVGCGRETRTADPPLVVFAAGSLARPLRAALDTIQRDGGPSVVLEIMGSRELLRAVTSLGRSPDLIVTADADEMERLLFPAFISSSTTFARNRVVLALGPRAPGADTITSANWAVVVASGALRVGRADPGRAPLGYRTQHVWQLAEYELQRPGLAQKLATAAPAALVRGNEADLAALLESDNADAAWCYESLARAMKLRYVTLGHAIDLGSTADSIGYRRASVLISGAAPGDSVPVRGSPIRYGIAVVNRGLDPVGASVLRERLLDATSRRVMRQAGLDVLDTPIVTTATTLTSPVP